MLAARAGAFVRLTDCYLSRSSAAAHGALNGHAPAIRLGPRLGQKGKVMKTSLALIVAAIGLSSAAAVAVAAPQGRGMERLKAADTNGDGLISLAEAQAALPRLAKHFDAIDANHDGQVSADELKAARAQRREKMRTAMFDRLDANHDGVISRDEFNAFRGGHHRGHHGHHGKQGA
jgi:hypothetical protein